jgi:DDE superfamily endonuclease
VAGSNATLTGTKTAHVGHQWLGRYGKTGNGVVTVTTLWADERLYYPVHAVPYSPARHFAKGKGDPGFRTKLAIGADLAVRARAAGFTFRAVAADSAYGDQDGFRGELAEAGLPFVMALKPRRGTWAYGADAYTPADAARALAWDGPDDPAGWKAVTRTFRGGHAETWYAADATLGWWGPDGYTRLVIATADPATLPAKATWYLATSLPRPGGPREPDSLHPAASLADLRHPALDRAGLQASQGRTGLGRLPGPLRHRDPPSPGPGQLRVLILLGCLVRRSGNVPSAAGTRRRRRREGVPGPPDRRGRRRPGLGRSGPSAPGLSRGSRCSAGGPHGRTRPRPGSCKP